MMYVNNHEQPNVAGKFVGMCFDHLSRTSSDCDSQYRILAKFFSVADMLHQAVKNAPQPSLRSVPGWEDQLTDKHREACVRLILEGESDAARLQRLYIPREDDASYNPTLHRAAQKKSQAWLTFLAKPVSAFDSLMQFLSCLNTVCGCKGNALPPLPQIGAGLPLEERRLLACNPAHQSVRAPEVSEVSLQVFLILCRTAYVFLRNSGV